MTFNLCLLDLFLFTVVAFVDCQGPAYLYGTSVTLPCSVTGTEPVAYTWSDVSVTPNRIIYFVLSSDESSKHSDVDGIAKYDNFGINNNHPSSVDLTIDSLDFNDYGIYLCSLSRGESPPDGLVIVEALPTSVYVSCTTSPPDECPESVGGSSEFTCTCTAVGAYPDDLHFEWTNAVGDPTSTSIENRTGRSGAFDYTGIATFKPTDVEDTVTCSLGGYNGSWSVPYSNFTVDPPGKCEISISCNDEATVATLTCSCPNGVPDNPSYTYYNESGAVVTDEVSVEPGVQFTVGCRGCNGVNYGEDTFISMTETCTVNSPGINAGLIAACSIVAVIFVAAMAFAILIFIRRYKTGLGQKPNKSLTKEAEATNDGTDNNAYMDLQERRNEKSRDTDALQIPERNVKLVSTLPGNGLLQYHKALITRTKGNQEGVVRTLSDNSTVAAIRILRSEVQENLKLGSDNNIVQLLGWCDTVPTFAIFELVRGRNLSNHLKEEFSPQSVHTYGNTKKKTFQVSEKGNIDVLPEYALHVARGIQFLTKNKFLHPGLRAKNVLLDTTGNCKLFDFVSLENAKEWTSIIWNESVPYQWMPPEFLFLEAISSAGDIWSFGVLLWEIFSYGSEPYIGEKRSNVERKIRQKELLRMPNNCPGAIWQLMLSCWQSSEEERLPIDDIAARLTPMCHQDKEYQEIR